MFRKKPKQFFDSSPQGLAEYAQLEKEHYEKFLHDFTIAVFFPNELKLAHKIKSFFKSLITQLSF